MIVYRIHKKQYDPLDGTGAALFGRRWNKRGKAVVYASTTLSLVKAEIGANTSIGELFEDYVISEIEIDDDFFYHTVTLDDLDDNWNKKPFPKSLQEYGSTLLQTYPIIQVPSIHDPKSNNVVIDPNHPEVKKRVKVINQYPLKN